MAMQGRVLSQTEVLKWVEAWDYTDRARITAALDAIPNAVCTRPPSGGYIGVWSNDRHALVIRPGYLEWPAGRWARDLPPGAFPDMRDDEHGQWHLLSTFRARDGGHGTEERPAEICPICNMAIPLSGVCDTCG